jgi:hypothetical protein
MSGGPRPFTQTDVQSVLRAYQKLGVDISRVALRIDRTGTIIATPTNKSETELRPDEWDSVLPMGDGHHA